MDLDNVHFAWCGAGVGAWTQLVWFLKPNSALIMVCRDLPSATHQ